MDTTTDIMSLKEIRDTLHLLSAVNHADTLNTARVATLCDQMHTSLDFHMKNGSI